jgi:hypothetical protein
MIDATVAPKVGFISPFGTTACNVNHISARAASGAASPSPAPQAATMRRARFPNPTDTTLASLRWGTAKILATRCLACVRVCTRATRVRGRSRQARISGGGTTRGVSTPGASSSASQGASLSSVLLPGRGRTSWLLAPIPCSRHSSHDRRAARRRPASLWPPRTLRRLPPVAQSDPCTGGGTTIDHLWGALAIVTDPTQTGRQRRRMHIDTATDRGDHLPGRRSCTWGD